MYALVRYAPDLLHITEKNTSDRNTTRYTVQGFSECDETSYQQPEEFEVNKYAPELSDEEVRKILTARCENNLIDHIVSQTWPNNEAEEHFGRPGTVAYNRADLLGIVVAISDSGYSVEMPGLDQPRFYAKNNDVTLRVVEEGEAIMLQNDSIHVGDVVFTVVAVTELDEPLTTKQPEVHALVGFIKLSLPIEYYREKQGLITEIYSCSGNVHKQCPQTPSIDIYPRGESPDPEIPYTRPEITDMNLYREIVGKVQSLSDHELYITDSSGAQYTVITPHQTIRKYNELYAPAYMEHGTNATLAIGSTVSIRYKEVEEGDYTIIAANRILQLSLLLEPFKKGSGTSQY